MLLIAFFFVRQSVFQDTKGGRKLKRINEAGYKRSIKATDKKL